MPPWLSVLPFYPRRYYFQNSFEIFHGLGEKRGLWTSEGGGDLFWSSRQGLSLSFPQVSSSNTEQKSKGGLGVESKESNEK